MEHHQKVKPSASPYDKIMVCHCLIARCQQSCCVTTLLPACDANFGVMWCHQCFQMTHISLPQISSDALSIFIWHIQNPSKTTSKFKSISISKWKKIWHATVLSQVANSLVVWQHYHQHVMPTSLSYDAINAFSSDTFRTPVKQHQKLNPSAFPYDEMMVCHHLIARCQQSCCVTTLPTACECQLRCHVIISMFSYDASMSPWLCSMLMWHLKHLHATHSIPQ